MKGDHFFITMSWDFVLVPVIELMTHLTSWLYSVAKVVDKCFDSMPRGPAGSNHGGLAEVDLYANDSAFVRPNSCESISEKIHTVQNSLKPVEMGSIKKCEVDSTDQGDGEGNQFRGCAGGGGHVCVVCLGDIEEEEKVYKLPHCNHIFHSHCLDRWVSHNRYVCPLCRTSLITGSSMA